MSRPVWRLFALYGKESLNQALFLRHKKHPTFGMLTIEQMLKIDPKLAELSEADLIELRDTLYEGAELAFEVYWSEKAGSKYPLRSLTNPPDSGIVGL